MAKDPRDKRTMRERWELFVDEVNFWSEFMRDKNYSMRFKILNILSGDYLRNYLMVGVYARLHNCIELVNNEDLPDDYKVSVLKRDLERVRRNVDDVCKI